MRKNLAICEDASFCCCREEDRRGGDSGGASGDKVCLIDFALCSERERVPDADLARGCL